MDRKIKILVVDDEAPVLGILKSMLTTFGYDVVTSDNGPKGLEIAQTENVDLVMMDVNLPGMDGLMAAFHLRSNPDTRNLPLIVMSGALDPQISDEAFHLGCFHQLAKPFTLMTLKETIAKALAGKTVAKTA